MPTEPWEPDWAIPPGETIEEDLEVRGWSRAELSTRTGLPIEVINGIIDDAKPIDQPIAEALAQATGISARLLLALEANYRNLVKIANKGLE